MYSFPAARHSTLALGDEVAHVARKRDAIRRSHVQEVQSLHCGMALRWRRGAPLDRVACNPSRPPRRHDHDDGHPEHPRCPFRARRQTAPRVPACAPAPHQSPACFCARPIHRNATSGCRDVMDMQRAQQPIGSWDVPRTRNRSLHDHPVGGPLAPRETILRSRQLEGGLPGGMRGGSARRGGGGAGGWSCSYYQGGMGTATFEGSTFTHSGGGRGGLPSGSDGNGQDRCS